MTNIRIRAIHQESRTEALFYEHHPMQNTCLGLLQRAGHLLVEQTHYAESLAHAAMNTGKSIVHFAQSTH
jgi:hypothetical protein